MSAETPDAADGRSALCPRSGTPRPGLFVASIGLPLLIAGAEGSGQSQDRDRAVFRIPAKGPTYYASWLALGFFGAFTGIGLFSGSLLIGSLFLPFDLLAVAGIVYFRTPRSFEADSLGIRVRHGTRLSKDFPWTEVKRVRIGLRPVTLARSVRPGPFLTVSRHGAHRGIDFDTQDYPGHPELDTSLAMFGEEVASLASLRGVPVERVDWTQPRRRR